MTLSLNITDKQAEVLDYALKVSAETDGVVTPEARKVYQGASWKSLRVRSLIDDDFRVTALGRLVVGLRKPLRGAAEEPLSMLRRAVDTFEGDVDTSRNKLAAVLAGEFIRLLDAGVREIAGSGADDTGDLAEV